MGTKDLGENLFVLDAIRAKNMTTAVYDSRANGGSSAGVIDLEDYNYPKEILIQVSVGAVAGSGKVDVDVESGDTAATVTDNTDYSFAQITAAGVATYHYTPTRRFINVEATVTGTSVDFCVTLIMGALGWGSSGQA